MSEFDDVIKYLADNLSVDVETDCPMFDEPAKIKVKLKIGDVVISQSSDSIYMGLKKPEGESGKSDE